MRLFCDKISLLSLSCQFSTETVIVMCILHVRVTNFVICCHFSLPNVSEEVLFKEEDVTCVGGSCRV